MKRETAEGLLMLVNDRQLYAAFQDYLKWRTELVQSKISSATDLRQLGEIQGALHELRQLGTLREAVLAHSKK